MKVYRIEHQHKKTGPYFARATAINATEYWGSRCPGPCEDGVWGLTCEHVFGFAKMKQLFTWFRARHVFKMRKEGFRVYRYKVPDEHVRHGYTQLAFIRSKATVREEVKMSLMVRHLCSF